MRVSALVLAILSASRAENQNCRCLANGADYGVTGSLTPRIGGQTYDYGASYGFASCVAHDNGKQPFCGGPVSDRPLFCAEQWCYVDPALCNVGLPAVQSAYFSDLFYSYATCGNENTFQQWFTASGSGAGDNHALTELATVVTNYVTQTINTLEDNEAELRGTRATCDYDSSCPSGGCCSCQSPGASWGSAPPITFQQTLSLPLANGPMPGSDACLGGIVSGTFQRVASSEASVDRVGYQYYGSDDGTYMGWPGVGDCGTSYDPRFRDWYAGAAAGPKDVIIVIDTSGSMGSTNPVGISRMAIAREAALKVVGTLTSIDYATVIGFSSSSNKWTNQLQRMSAANKALMRSWINSNLVEGGSTNFQAAFSAVANVISASTSSTTNCNRIVLFLSDGVPNSWSTGDYATATAQLQGAQLVTYALGSGASSVVLKQLACENEGILYEVADNDNLGDVMAGYYKLLSPELDPCQPRWIEYEDIYTGNSLLAVCMAAYRKYSTADANSCSGGTSGYGTGTSSSADWYKVPKLLGVACIDMQLIATDAEMRAHPGWSGFEARYRSEQSNCPQRSLTEGQREALRRDVSLSAMCASAPPIPPSLIAEPSYSATGSARQCARAFSSSGDDEGGAGGLLGGLAPLVIGVGVVMYLRKQHSARIRARNAKARAPLPPAQMQMAPQPQPQMMPTAVAQPMMTGQPMAQAQPMIMGQPMDQQQMMQQSQTTTTTTTTQQAMNPIGAIMAMAMPVGQQNQQGLPVAMAQAV